MKLSFLHRVIFTFILSAIMSGSMTYMVSSFYCEAILITLTDIWVQAWATAFTVILLLSPFLHTFAAFIVRNYGGVRDEM